MRFGPVPVKDAPGGIVAHAVHAQGLVLKKGDIVRVAHVSALIEAGVHTIVVAQLDDGDVDENQAARQVAQAIGGSSVSVDRAFTGRANLFARTHGILRIDVAAVDRLNGLNEALTLATLPDLRAVETGEMIGTVKIIPFAISADLLADALGSVTSALIDIAPFRPLDVAVISTVLPGLKAQVITKTLSHLADRLAPAQARIIADERVPHDTAALSRAIRACVPRADLVVIFGASAIADRRDVVPAAIEAAGGRVERFGMPVDPGNLLLLAELGGKPILGAPGCARSPKENGFDWVLHRLLAGIPVTGTDVLALGVGGLLMEIVTRPQPRSEAIATMPSRAEEESSLLTEDGAFA